MDTTNDQEIIYYSDYDYDGTVERIRYTLSGTRLTKGVIEPSGDPITYQLSDESEFALSEIIRNGTDPIFYYYNSDWPEDTTNNPLVLEERIAETRYIKIFLNSNTKADSSEFDYELESDVKLRSIIEN